jgi:uncharacterized protein YfkK (UPF0435 family)
MDTKLIEKVENFKKTLLSCVTGGYCDSDKYKLLRRELCNNSNIKSKLPKFVIECTDIGECRSFIIEKFSTYRDRRDYLKNEFLPIFSELEAEHTSLSSNSSTTEALTNIDSEHIKETWNKALDRKINDPDGAITSSRTLLEAVCKHILDKENIYYDDKSDLPQLYNILAQKLNLSPSQHNEKLFKKILGNCHEIIKGIGSIRNKLGDAHGKGIAGTKPATRHAELVVNLAGTMTTFIFSTWAIRKERVSENKTLSYENK